jgi:hypothetical protein
MDIRDREELGGFVREHHVHYEVEPAAVTDGERREVVGYEVRLFATHSQSRLPAPGCPRCLELVSELRSFAERLVSPGHAVSWTGIAPVTPALYQSGEVPSADEVSLTMHVLCDSPEHRGAGTGERLCLEEIRERLGAVGVPRR